MTSLSDTSLKDAVAKCLDLIGSDLQGAADEVYTELSETGCIADRAAVLKAAHSDKVLGEVTGKITVTGLKKAEIKLNGSDRIFTADLLCGTVVMV